MKIQKKLASKLAKRSHKKVALDPYRMQEINEAITRADIRRLLEDGAITVGNKKGVSRSRAKQKNSQRVKGRRKGHGKRRGKQGARQDQKIEWMRKVRLQRAFLKSIKGKISTEAYKDLYRKVKGGFFRSKRHIKLYLTERKIVK